MTRTAFWPDAFVRPSSTTFWQSILRVVIQLALVTTFGRQALTPAITMTVLLITTAPVSVAATDFDDATVEAAARESLQQNDFPWYDADQDDVRSVVIDTTPPKPPVDLKRWDFNAPDVNLPSVNTTGFWKVVEWIVRVVVVVVLISTLIYFIRTALREGRWFAARRDDRPTGDVSDASEQVEKLPFPVERPKTDLLDEARRYYENGDYARAIVYLFSYQLVHLDKNHFIHLSKGKTNRQYLRELNGSRSTIRNALHRTMVTFEEVFFGGHVLDKRRFDACWGRLEEFHRDVQQHAPVGTNTP